jgi:hypothetical protein
MVSIVVPVSYFIDYIVAFFLIRVELRSKKVLKEEKLQDGEHDKKLDEDDDPQLSSNGHAAEAVIIEVKDPVKNVLFQI